MENFFLILSKCKEKRYKDNMLTMLSAPINTVLQFRYDKDLLDENVYETLTVGTNRTGIVAYVDVEYGEPSIVPAREN